MRAPPPGNVALPETTTASSIRWLTSPSPPEARAVQPTLTTSASVALPCDTVTPRVLHGLACECARVPVLVLRTPVTGPTTNPDLQVHGPGLATDPTRSRYGSYGP
jgi:hypothetical protein